MPLQFVIDKERRGDYLGKTVQVCLMGVLTKSPLTSSSRGFSYLEAVSHGVSLSTHQVVPHITDAIQEWIERVAMIPVDGKEGPADVCVIELGGTIGNTISLIDGQRFL